MVTMTVRKMWMRFLSDLSPYSMVLLTFLPPPLPLYPHWVCAEKKQASWFCQYMQPFRDRVAWTMSWPVQLVTFQTQIRLDLPRWSTPSICKQLSVGLSDILDNAIIFWYDTAWCTASYVENMWGSVAIQWTYKFSFVKLIHELYCSLRKKEKTATSKACAEAQQP